MSMSADQKISMSLEDLIKARKEAQPKKKGAAKKKSTAAKPAPTARNRRRKGTDDKPKGLGAKATKAVATSSAKRAAKVAQRRGLNTTGKATKTQVKTAITKAQEKALKTTGMGRRGKGGRTGVRIPTSVAASMKISFKPTELKMTTDKSVSKQITAVLAKQGRKQDSNQRGAKSVFTSASAPGQKQKKSNPNANRGGPKARSGNLRVRR
mmetsp:Transcript_3554/g.9128  ORF Transcript_3554/g.9128 Transcript_3554/m.9128 type:complete len:210 (-) Transcript_3554:119-748(-)